MFGLGVSRGVGIHPRGQAPRHSASNSVDHETYKEDIAGGTIPINFDEGPGGIRCPKCDERTAEDRWDWTDTAVWAEDEGDWTSYDVQRVWLACPECGEESAFEY